MKQIKELKNGEYFKTGNDCSFVKEGKEIVRLHDANYVTKLFTSTHEVEVITHEEAVKLSKKWHK